VRVIAREEKKVLLRTAEKLATRISAWRPRSGSTILGNFALRQGDRPGGGAVHRQGPAGLSNVGPAQGLRALVLADLAAFG
jgi:hypothetical protein